MWITIWQTKECIYNIIIWSDRMFTKFIW
jgi:hypothetical protein